jgi:hypothetical protein
MKILTDQHKTLRTKLSQKHGINWDSYPKLDSHGRSLTSTGVDRKKRKVSVSTHWDGGRDVFDRVPSRYLKEEKVVKAIKKVAKAAYNTRLPIPDSPPCDVSAKDAMQVANYAKMKLRKKK